MDPITAVGAIASILTLAETALSLSKTLYSVCGAVASASEDIQNLAEDLNAFSQSLTLLSRLLEDSKSWYSDDVYVLTAKIIKDCAELYANIDKILRKLGKGSWIRRFKFVLKESQIKKLLKRLRDMKGTLATILMSLQVDLQLSLLNISSASKIQRAPEMPLQPKTIEMLRAAQTAVEDSELLSRNSTHSVDILETTLQVTRVLPKDAIQPVAGSQFQIQHLSNGEAFSMTSEITHKPPQSLKSVSSLESFKSAISDQEQELEIVREVEGVKHAFCIALRILRHIMKKRFRDIQEEQVYRAVQRLKCSLVSGESHVGRAHRSHYKKHGQSYLRFLWKAGQASKELQAVVLTLMREVVATLHIYSSEHEMLTPIGFSHLREWSEKCQIKALMELDQVSALLLRRNLKFAFRSNGATVDREWSKNVSARSSELQPPPTVIEEDNLKSEPPRRLSSLILIVVTKEDIEARLTADETWLKAHMCESSLQSQADFSESPFYKSIPSASLLLDAAVYEDKNDEDQISFPSYDDVGYYGQVEDLEPPTRSRTVDLCSGGGAPYGASTDVSRAESPDLVEHAGDDAAVREQDSRYVDYSSHDWKEEDIWSTWKHIVSKRKAYHQSARLENSLWRAWTKSKYRLKTVPPMTLNWLKDCDVTWLSGPLQTCLTTARPKDFIGSIIVGTRYSSCPRRVTNQANDASATHVSHEKAQGLWPSEGRMSGQLDVVAASARSSKSSTLPSRVSQSFPSEAQAQNLWWQTYSVLQRSQPSLIEKLDGILDDYLPRPAVMTSDEAWSDSISNILRALTQSLEPVVQGPTTPAKVDIIKVVEMISATLGVHIAPLPWACVCVLLQLYYSVPKVEEGYLSHLFVIVSIVARYSVMENLYHRNSGMRLHSGYQKSLLDLCTLILQYFATAFESWLHHPAQKSEFEKCSKLVDSIKELDRTCQRFTVTVEMEGDELESESDGDIEDISDEVED